VTLDIKIYNKNTLLKQSVTIIYNRPVQHHVLLVLSKKACLGGTLHSMKGLILLKNTEKISILRKKYFS